MSDREYFEYLKDLAAFGGSRLSWTPVQEATEKSESREDCPATEPGIRITADCQRAWPVASDCLSDQQIRRDLPKVDETTPDYRARIASVCDNLRDFLLEKNASYGNSAFEPINVFSRLDAREGILIRIDDKLKRLRNGSGYVGDNDVKDLAGYLILLMVLDEVSK